MDRSFRLVPNLGEPVGLTKARARLGELSSLAFHSDVDTPIIRYKRPESVLMSAVKFDYLDNVKKFVDFADSQGVKPDYRDSGLAAAYVRSVSRDYRATALKFIKELRLCNSDVGTPKDNQ